MLVHRRIDKNELATLKDPFIKCNFDKIYRNIMVNDDATWTALSYLQECKNTLPGFDYQIHYGLDGLPDCIMYITSEMRSNLLRYGDIFFLDAQKRAFNAMGWPYIGIALFNNEMMVCVCCEAICQSETIEMYTWIILTIMLLEPRWNTSKLRMIFGDGFITQSLLQNLKIVDTCLLHGDYFHLLNEIWPKSEKFGTQAFSLIKD